MLRTRLRADGEQPLEAVIVGVERFQCAILKHNFLCRGGMSLGLGYANEEVVFGHALLDAHRLEKNIAIAPRIILSHSVCRLVARQLDSRSDPDCPLAMRILEDHDGQWFVNYLANALKSRRGDSWRIDASVLVRHKDVLEKGLSNKDPHVKAKYVWATVYHNWFLKHYKLERAHQDLKVNPRTLALPMAPTVVRKPTVQRYLDSYRRRLRDGEDIDMAIGVRVARRRPTRVSPPESTQK